MLISTTHDDVPTIYRDGSMNKEAKTSDF